MTKREKSRLVHRADRTQKGVLFLVLLTSKGESPRIEKSKLNIKMEQFRQLTSRAAQEVHERSSVLIEHTTFYGKSKEKLRFLAIRSEIDNYYLGRKVRFSSYCQ